MINGVQSGNSSQIYLQQVQNASGEAARPATSDFHNGKSNPTTNPFQQDNGIDIQISNEARDLYKSSVSEKTEAENENLQGLTEAEQADVEKLQRIDRQVRAHEQAHVAAGGSLIRRGASFEYQIGPDGRRYAVAGEVTIDVSKEQDPEATLRKAARVRAAAMAPADPSPQDRRVAAEAAAMAREASMEIMQEKTQESNSNVETEAVSNVATPSKQDEQKSRTSSIDENENRSGQRSEQSQDEGVSAFSQVGRDQMISAARAYQGTFAFMESSFNRMIFA
ncbi:hypothetical protein EH221_07225 [bacterium]|nr:MAG: hypothetical protein EH221_07225 [bacterium]